MSDKSELTYDIEKYHKAQVLEEEYNVEKILDKKKVGSTWKYKVKWEGYSDDECTWEPKENLRNVNYLIDEYEANQEDKEIIKKEKINLLKNKTKRSTQKLNKSNKEDEISNSVASSDKKNSKDNCNFHTNLTSNQRYFN